MRPMKDYRIVDDPGYEVGSEVRDKIRIWCAYYIVLIISYFTKA